MIETELTLDEQVRLLLSSPEPLRRWLVKECGPVAGQTSSPRDCPIALFLKSRLAPNVSPAVFADSISIYPSTTENRTPLLDVHTPRWVRTFVLAVDYGPAAEGRLLLLPVHRDRALTLLQEITQNALG